MGNSNNTYSRLYKKQNPTGGEVLGLIALVLLVSFLLLGFTAWIVMLLLGALGSELGFTGPSYFATFIGVWLVKIVAGWFKTLST